MKHRRGRPLEADAEVTRQRILDVALQQLADRGYARTTLRSIAAGANITSGAVYHYFDSKEALVTSLLQDVRDFIMGRTSHVADLDLPLRSKFVILLEDSASIYSQRPELASLSAQILPDALLNSEFGGARVAIMKSFEDYYGSLVDKAILRHEVSSQVSRDGLVKLFIGLIQGMATVAAATPSEYRRAVHALEMVMTGDLLCDA
jgi:AcrR family transcriptional regulator